MKRKDIPTKLVIQSCLESHQQGCHKASWEIILEKTKAPIKIIYAAIKRDIEKGYLLYGVSERTAWPSKKGIKFLKGENT